MPIFPNYSVTKTVMTDKVEGKLLKVAGISSVENTHLSQNKGQWLVVTRKAYKTQVKTEVDHILRGMTLHIISPTYNDIPGTIAREYRDLKLISYAVALQGEIEHGPKI